MTPKSPREPTPDAVTPAPKADSQRRPPAGPGGPTRLKFDPLYVLREEESVWDWLKREAPAGVPAILVSLALHLTVMLILALIVYSNGGPPLLESLVLGWSSPEAEAAKAAAFKNRAVVEIAAVATVPQTTATTKNTKPVPEEVPVTPGTEGPLAAGKPPEVKQALSGRGGPARDSLLKLFGGTKQSEGAVSMGLKWLAKQQKSDGRWELHQGYDDPSRPGLKTDTGATALALLAYLGAGNTQQGGAHQQQVKKGLDWLVKNQKLDGDLHDWNELGRQTAFYAHGQATIVLCEAYALTRDAALLEPAKKALLFIQDAQHPGGGWKYQPGAEGDLSVTGWQIMALQSARMSGIPVPEEVLEKASQFLDSVGLQNGSRYKYMPTDPDSRFSPALTAEALLCRQYLGWPKEHPAMQNGVAFLLQPENMPQWKEGQRNVYYWYYATQVMHHIEGEEWSRWNPAVRDAITQNQVRAGKMGGSWNPTKPKGADHEYAEAAGRLYLTCLCILTLEVYYRHLPLYREDVPAETLNP